MTLVLTSMQGGAAVSRLNSPAFVTWLENSNVLLTTGRAEYLFNRFDANNDGEVDVQEYVRMRLASSDKLLCHSAEDASTSAQAFPGCPCNPVAGGAIGRCPAGVAL